MAYSTRGVHPDLLDELEQQQAAPPPEKKSIKTVGKARGSPTPPPPESNNGTNGTAASDERTPTDAVVPAVEQTPAAPPEWLDELKAKTDPKEIVALVGKHVDRDLLMQDPVISGYVGGFVDRRAKALLSQQEQQRLESERQAAFEKGDVYTLGQMTQAQLAEQQRALEAESQIATSPYMAGVRRFQEKFPQEVQQKVAGKTFGAGKPADEAFAEYLTAIHEAKAEYDEQERRKREPALRKALLSETVGSEPGPELEGGRPPAVREITDEQLARMSLKESEQYLDERGVPRPGVRLRLTRGIDLSRAQR